MIAGGSSDIKKTRTQLACFPKTGSFGSIFQVKFRSIISKVELANYKKELWGHIFVGHIGIPIICLVPKRPPIK